MKTIKQIADELGVSKQAVHKRIRQNPLSTSLQGLTKTIGNTMYVDVDGETLIKSAFDKSVPTTTTINAVDDLATQFIASLQGQIATLTEQLKAKDEQIAFLQQSFTTQQALHAGTIQQQLTDGRDTAPMSATAAADPPEDNTPKYELKNGKIRMGEPVESGFTKMVKGIFRRR